MAKQVVTDDDQDIEIDEPTQAGMDMSALAGAIVTAVNAAQGERQVSFSEYEQRVNTHRHKPELTRKCYQNGIMLQRDQLSADAIHLLNMIKPGTYGDGLLTVSAVQDGAKLSALDIRYQNKTVDDRMQLKSAYPTFEHMLAAIAREMEQAGA